MANSLHYQDSQAEIHRVVVGPMDNNVYVLRCKETGDAVLLGPAAYFERIRIAAYAGALAGFPAYAAARANPARAARFVDGAMFVVAALLLAQALFVP